VGPFATLLAELDARRVRFLVIGVWGVNCYAKDAGAIFRTLDRDLFLPCDAANLLRAWEACDAAGLEMTCAGEPLDEPRDAWLAGRIVERKALTRATLGTDLVVDLTLVMAGFDFETVWPERRAFVSEGAPLPVARLSHILESKAAAGRDKDRLFLATHAEALRDLLSAE